MSGIYWLASYPKSGNTWFRMLVANLSATDKPVDINDLPERGGIASARGSFDFGFEKDFHVSPFMPLDMDYRWRFSEPGQRLAVHMENSRDGTAVFDATLALARREITGASLAGVLLRFPFSTLRVLTAIYWQALRLKLKGGPVHAHPRPARPTSW